MPDLLNWELLRNPYNYFVVALMIATALVAITYLLPSPPTSQS